MKYLLKYGGKVLTLICVCIFAGMFLYFMFCGHKSVDGNAFDKAMMFFAGMSLSGLIGGGKVLYRGMKNSELVQELKNEFRNKKEKKEQAKLSKVETPKVEETTNGSDNTN